MSHSDYGCIPVLLLYQYCSHDIGVGTKKVFDTLVG